MNFSILITYGKTPKVTANGKACNSRILLSNQESLRTEFLPFEIGFKIEYENPSAAIRPIIAPNKNTNAYEETEELP